MNLILNLVTLKNKFCKFENSLNSEDDLVFYISFNGIHEYSRQQDYITGA